MSTERAAELFDAPLTYTPVGVSLSGDRPVRRWQRRIGLGVDDFDRASEALLSWRAHVGAGLHVVASSAHVTKGSVVDLFLGCGRVAVRAPCRIVAVVDEPGRRGFAYGTLPGHPESGEEAFLIEQDENGVRFTIVAVSRPASRAARIGGPLTRAVQGAVVRRYLYAVTR